MMENIKFAEVGENVKIYPYNTFILPENIHLLSNIIISEYSSINGGMQTVIGNYVHVSSFVSILGGGLFICEDFTGIAAGARIITGTDLINGEGIPGPTIPLEFRAFKRSFVHLEKHVFVGTNVVIHPGITIGEGAVIGSASVVTKDIEPWTINVGTPAKPVAQRKSAKIMESEQKIYEQNKHKKSNLDEFLKIKKTITQVEY